MPTSRRVSILVGEQRRKRLIAHGFRAGFLEALDSPTADAVTPRVAHASGEVILDIPERSDVLESLPPGSIVPVLQQYDWDMTYCLLVEGDGSSRLVWWHPSQPEGEPIDGGVVGLLTDLAVTAWEAGVDAADLEAWALRVGYPVPARLVAALEETERTGARRTYESLLRWRREFLASLV